MENDNRFKTVQSEVDRLDRKGGSRADADKLSHTGLLKKGSGVHDPANHGAKTLFTSSPRCIFEPFFTAGSCQSMFFQQPSLIL